MTDRYSRQTIGAFVLLAVAFVGMVFLLIFLHDRSVITFSTKVDGDLLKLLASLPFVAFYLVVFLAATAGYARSAIMMKTMPLTQMLHKELKKKTMESATIQTKIRSGGQVSPDTPFSRALSNIISSRLPILAVVDQENKVHGVITSHDILRVLQEEIDRKPEPAIAALPPLNERLADLTVENLQPRDPETVTADQNLQSIVDTMLKEQFTKLIVVGDKKSMKFKGTVDVLDLLGEMFGENSEESTK